MSANAESLIIDAVMPAFDFGIAEHIIVRRRSGGELPGWLLLGEQPDRELAFGAVGKFWQPSRDNAEGV
jgi:hypothetical protein